MVNPARGCRPGAPDKGQTGSDCRNGGQELRVFGKVEIPIVRRGASLIGLVPTLDGAVRCCS